MTDDGPGVPPGQREAIFAQWKLDIAEIARCPNVIAKLGGLAMPDNGWGWDKRDRPASSDCHEDGASLPTGVSAPTPVTTTRLMTATVVLLFRRWGSSIAEGHPGRLMALAGSEHLAWPANRPGRSGRSTRLHDIRMLRVTHRSLMMALSRLDKDRFWSHRDRLQ